MEGEARVECSKIIEIIDRLGRCETVSDEETAQLIDHVSICKACKDLLYETLVVNPFIIQKDKKAT